MIVSTKTAAMREPAAHKLVPGIGYVRLAQPQGFGRFPQDQCHPPMGTVERSFHMLMPPGGAAPIVFRWVAQCWVNDDPKSNRLGYRPEYLSSHGWVYLAGSDATVQ